jgi:group II intron reverse transcriptase/maturase
MGTLEDIINPLNLNDAYKRVVRNRGSGGVDRMTVDELLPYLKLHGGEIVRDILCGRYRPLPVRRVEIPKDNGKMRQLGIPTAVDRMVQQAIAQVLTPMYEPQFVETSYGFRPGRGAHDAIRKCREYLNAGYVWTVDMDLEKFFDTVNQSKLLEVLSRTVKDGRVISLISKYLRAGVVKCGRFEDTEIGVPQGGPLSPLLANVMLNELDHELKRRGHKFVRYADDMVIFCKSKASAEQTLRHIIPFIEGKLFLKVNRVKTVVAYAGTIKFLGYGFYKGKKGFGMRVHAKSIAKMQDKVRELTDRRRLRAKEAWTQSQTRFVTGWVNYFKLADMATFLQRTDEWMRRRIRMVFLKRWKKYKTKYQNLKHLGLNEDDARKIAYSRKGYWHIARGYEIGRALPNDRLERAGFKFFSTYYQSVHTA